MPAFARVVLGVLLSLVAAFGIFPAAAAGEFPEAQWAYCLIDGTVGLASVAGACGLGWPRRPHA